MIAGGRFRGILNMKLAQILKINFLVLGLIVVVFLMLRLKSGSLRDSVNDLFGAPNNEVLTENVEKSRVWSWCLSQVTAIEAGSRRVFREADKWIFQVGEKREWLETAAVRNWLAQSCNLSIFSVPIEGLDLALFSPDLVLSFESGPQLHILSSKSGVYLAENQAFRSSDLDEAKKRLESLPRQKGN